MDRIHNPVTKTYKPKTLFSNSDGDHENCNEQFRDPKYSDTVPDPAFQLWYLQLRICHNRYGNGSQYLTYALYPPPQKILSYKIIFKIFDSLTF